MSITPPFHPFGSQYQKGQTIDPEWPESKSSPSHELLETAKNRRARLDQPHRPLGHWARIISGANPYEWNELFARPGGGWVDGPRSGTIDERPAYEANGLTSVVPGSVVWLDQPQHAPEERRFLAR